MSLSILPILLALSGAHPSATPLPLDAAFQTWEASHGPNWRLFPDARTGRAEMIAGGNVILGDAPRNEQDAQTLASIALETTRELFGAEAATLRHARTLFLPLEQIGSGDKWTVRYEQHVRGIRVDGGFVNVLVSSDGRLLSVQSTALPRIADMSIQPEIAPARAADSALAAFEAELARHADHAGSPELVIARFDTEDSRVARLAWKLVVDSDMHGENAAGRAYWIDARNGAVLMSESTVHNAFDVTGTVVSKATPGVAPDTATNPETDQTMRYARVQSSAGTIFADANGVFTYPGVNTPLSCTFTYVGTYNTVNNDAGAEYSLVQSIPANAPTTVTMNPVSSDQVTAQANAVVGVNRMIDWIHALNPTDTTPNLQFTSNVNQASTCNAFYNGNSINFFLPGGGCPNTSYSTVVGHELGHWLNVLYGTTNNSDGIGEGGADIWSMYNWDTPVIAQDFFAIGSPIRTGLNTSPFCADSAPSCHGGAHANGEPWMGAAWKIRARLNTTLGNAPGDLVADLIFYGWNATYNQTQLRSIIETQWLTLDDNDGNINNGTPHYTDIDLGFRDQGWPGVTLIPLGISNVTQLADTTNSAGPYVVQAAIVANAAPPLTSRFLKWRVGNGPFTTLAMNALGSDNYEASIPGQPLFSSVQYYIEASDASATVVRSPKGAPEQLYVFDVGDVRVVRADNFDSPGAQGWTTGTIGDTSNSEVDWQRQNPAGSSGNSGGTLWYDPQDAVSLGFCWGNDIGLGGTDGQYGANVHNYLRSPVINCSAAVNTRLRFKSWVSVEGNAADQARVLVNGVEVYSNPATARLDREWGSQEFDISSIADGNASVTIEFRLRTNGSNQYGGWNLDDVRVLYVLPPACTPGTNYCVTSPNSSTGGTVMAYAGTTNLTLNNLVLISNASPSGTTGQFYYGRTTTLAPFGNGFRCVGGTVYRLPAVTTDAFGDAYLSLNLNALSGPGTIAAGDTCYFQFWYRNPAAGGAGFNLSDGLQLNFCP